MKFDDLQKGMRIAWTDMAGRRHQGTVREVGSVLVRIHEPARVDGEDTFASRDMQFELLAEASTTAAPAATATATPAVPARVTTAAGAPAPSENRGGNTKGATMAKCEVCGTEFEARNQDAEVVRQAGVQAREAGAVLPQVGGETDRKGDDGA